MILGAFSGQSQITVFLLTCVASPDDFSRITVTESRALGSHWDTHRCPAGVCTQSWPFAVVPAPTTLSGCPVPLESQRSEVKTKSCVWQMLSSWLMLAPSLDSSTEEKQKADVCLQGLLSKFLILPLQRPIDIWNGEMNSLCHRNHRQMKQPSTLSDSSTESSTLVRDCCGQVKHRKHSRAGRPTAALLGYSRNDV